MERDTEPPKALGPSLFISHFLSMWNSRGFEFGAVLFLATIFPGTLLPMSIYALLRALAAILFSAKVGSYIDSAHRLHVARLSIVAQRVAVVLSCGIFALLIQSQNALPRSLSLILFTMSAILACIEKVFSVMNTVAIERDWVVVIAAEDDLLLRKLNAQMRRIDLSCKLLSPLGIAFLHSWSPALAVWITLGINAASAVVEYSLIAKTFHDAPLLSERVRNSPESDHEEREEAEQPFLDGSQSLNRPEGNHVTTWKSSILMPLLVYIRQSAFLPSLTLSVLYLTVLSFSGQMTTFLLAIPNPKLGSGTIGLLRTVSTVAELSSTFAAPKLMAKIGPVRAGIWFLSWQAMMLTPAVCFLWADTSSFGLLYLFLFIAAIIASRFGLWSFDLCAQLIIQESINAEYRGLFSTVEAALQNFFELCAFATTIIFPKPTQFRYPAAISLVAVYCSAALYAKFVRDRRGHLLHVPCCLKPVEVHDSQRHGLLAMGLDGNDHHRYSAGHR